MLGFRFGEQNTTGMELLFASFGRLPARFFVPFVLLNLRFFVWHDDSLTPLGGVDLVG